MSRASILILLGVLLIFVPFSGLPTANRSLIEVILGACVLGFGISLRSHDARKAQSKVETSPRVSTEAPLQTEDEQETPYS